MANDRNDWNDDYRGSQERGHGYSSGRDQAYDNARSYPRGNDGYGGQDRNFRGGGTGYGGDRDDRPDNRGGRETYGSGGRDYYGGSNDQDRGGSGYGQQRFGGGYDQGRGSSGYGQQRSGGGGYGGQSGSGGQRWSGGSDGDRGGSGGGGRDYGRAPQGYDYQDRGFVERAGDEIRSWFGDEDAEKRRDYDQRYDERQGGYGSSGGSGGSSRSSHHGDADYHNWRRGQMDALDRDYHEYRQENAKKFENDFGSWRTSRQTQRTSLGQVKEHMDVVGSDGGHVGTVDKVRGDRIILTKNDSDAGGRHHSIPSSWLQSVDDKVTISKTADDAHKHWRDEERSSDDDGSNDRGGNLNRSFSGTY